MIYVGVDPSFTKTGVCYLDTDNKLIKFVPLKPDGKNTDYKTMLERSLYIVDGIVKHIDSSKEHRLVIEEPLLVSIKASSLGILSGVVVKSLMDISHIKEIKMIRPNYISNLNRTIAKRRGLTKKAASKEVALEVLEHMTQKYNYEIELYTDIINKDGSKRKRVLSHDEAESFLLLVGSLLHINFFDKDDIDKLSQINRKFNKKPKVTVLKESKDER